MLKTWLKNKVLNVEMRYDAEQRKERGFIIPGEWKDTNENNSDAAPV